MLNDTLVFLKNSLNAHLKMRAAPNDPQEDQVVFLTGQSADSLSFKLGAVSLLLVNLEQDNILRAPDLYQRTLADGSVERVQPEIRLNLYALFVANYQQYEDSLRNLSEIIQYFQNHRLITQQNAPALSENIQQLVIELVTQSFSEQNEIWGALRSHYHLSVLYKVKMVVYQSDASAAAPVVQEKAIQVAQ